LVRVFAGASRIECPYCHSTLPIELPRPKADEAESAGLKQELETLRKAKQALEAVPSPTPARPLPSAAHPAEVRAEAEDGAEIAEHSEELRQIEAEIETKVRQLKEKLQQPPPFHPMREMPIVDSVVLPRKPLVLSTMQGKDR
jgi:hypothetical protein